MQSIPRLSMLAACLLTASAQAQVTVHDAWVRATVPQQTATGAFMRFESASDLKLVAVSSPLTPAVEIHEMAMQNDVMRMRQVHMLDVPAGKIVELKPGGYHVMLLSLKQQVKVGETVSLKLEFENAGGKRQSVDVLAKVRPLAASAPAGGEASHHGHGH